MNRFIISMIAKAMVDTNKWDKVIQLIEYAVNNTVCRSTNSPSKYYYLKLIKAMNIVIRFGRC